MDYIEINKITRDKITMKSRNNLYSNNSIDKTDSLILMIDACKKLYGTRNTVKIIRGLGVKNFDLSI